MITVIITSTIRGNPRIDNAYRFFIRPSKTRVYYVMALSIYPEAMKLNKENSDNQKATFLDLDETIINNKIIVKVYDKRDDYKFEIVNYPRLSGNIPLKAAYGVFSSQIIRYARICSLEQELAISIRTLVGKLVKKGYKLDGLKFSAKTCFKRHPWILNNIRIRPYRKFLDSCIVV